MKPSAVAGFVGTRPGSMFLRDGEIERPADEYEGAERRDEDTSERGEEFQ